MSLSNFLSRIYAIHTVSQQLESGQMPSAALLKTAGLDGLDLTCLNRNNGELVAPVDATIAHAQEIHPVSAEHGLQFPDIGKINEPALAD